MVKGDTFTDSDLVKLQRLTNLPDGRTLYNENACYVADSPESLRRFLDSAMLPTEQYDVKSVTLQDLLNDFGVSSGEYALEPLALARFGRLAQARALAFDVEPYEGAPDELFVVKL